MNLATLKKHVPTYQSGSLHSNFVTESWAGPENKASFIAFIHNNAGMLPRMYAFIYSRLYLCIVIMISIHA